MNSTVKTVLLVGGVAVGVVLLMRALAPSPAAAATKAANKPTDMISLNSIFQLGSSIVSAFGSSGGSQNNDGTYHADTSGFSISGNTLLDASGNEVTYGAGY